ncbi:MAG: phytanoyl-CoA dioxygenase family protein [Cyanobacteria bacterium SBLK]|nr:phytanoyl-CoA dioxygenase family protein [Cyanobacteria bacterium SBLK]
MIKFDNLKTQWNTDGYIIFPNFIDAVKIKKLRRICDRILEQIQARREANREFKDVTNIAYLTEIQYFQDDRLPLIELLEFIGSPQIVGILEKIAGEIPLFHNTQYFYQPKFASWEGDWHRDSQFDAPDVELEKIRMQEFTGVHFRVAFLTDDRLEYIPGSQKRWDTEIEFNIRKGRNPKFSNMPDRQRIHLKPGDACLFHAWGIHRGSYRIDKPRRTLDIIYGWGGKCYFTPPAMCFSQPSILDSLSEPARQFFVHFIETYRHAWE